MTTEVLNIKQSKEKVSICQQVKNDVAMYIVTDMMAELRLFFKFIYRAQMTDEILLIPLSPVNIIIKLKEIYF